MSHPLLQPLFLSESEVTASAQELLAQDFVSELNLTLDDSNDKEDLKQSIQNAMAKANFSAGEIKEMIEYFFQSPDDAFLPFFGKANDNARRFGFGSMRALRAAATEETFNPKLRCYEINLSVSTFAELSKCSPLILTDQPAHYYRSLLGKFCKKRPCEFSSSLHPRVQQIAGKTRRNAIQLLTTQPESCSLNKLANNEEITLRRYIPRKKVSLLLNTGNKQQLELDQLAVFNCFLCPAMTEEVATENPHESLAGYARDNPTFPCINYKRLIPYDGAKALLHHIRDQHSTSIREDDSCSLVLPCKTCIQSHIANPDQTPLDAAFVCCGKCGVDHSLILHSTANRLLGLYSSLEADFRYNTAAKHHLEHFLLTQCFMCGRLFKSKELMESHQLMCISAFSCLSSGFGRPLASEIFFTTSFIKAKEDEECLSHALEQLTKLVQELRGSIPGGTEDPLTKRAASALSTLVPEANQTQNPAMADRGNGKGKAGKRGSSKSSKTPLSSMPPGLGDEDDDDDYVDDEVLTSPRTIHSPDNNDGTDNTRNQRDNIEEERIWMEAARLESSLHHQEQLDQDELISGHADDDDQASTVVKLKQEKTLADCSPPPAKRKLTL